MGVKRESINAEFSLSYSSKNDNAFNLSVAMQIPVTGVTAIFGASGSGKTSLLRCMAGLEKADSACMSVGELVWQDENSFVPVHKRQQGMVFQEASLFAHLTVQENLDYALKRVARKRIFRLVAAASYPVEYKQILGILGVENLLSRYPSSLSGGERQRVAIARALLRKPKILFMDEPLSALDFKRKQEILPYLERLSQVCYIPIIYITHSLEEVARLADYLVVLDEGRVVAQGELQDVLSRVDLPITLEHDLGALLKVKIVEKDERWHLMRTEFDGGELWLKDNAMLVGESLRVRVLAKDVSLSLSSQDSSILNSLPAEVIEVANDYDDAMALVRLKIGRNILISRVTRRSVDHLSLAAKCPVWVQIKSVAILP